MIQILSCPTNVSPLIFKLISYSSLPTISHLCILTVKTSVSQSDTCSNSCTLTYLKDSSEATSN